METFFTPRKRSNSARNRTFSLEDFLVKDESQKMLDLLKSSSNEDIVQAIISSPEKAAEIFEAIISLHNFPEAVHPDVTTQEQALTWTICAKYIKWSPNHSDILPMSVLKTIGAAAPKRVCQYAFRKNDIVWICKNCQTDETCVLCNTCYRESNHEGHEVYFYHAQAGGCCDCGDADAWDKDGFCPSHGQQDDHDPLANFPKQLIEPARSTIQKVTQFLYDTAQEVVLSYDIDGVKAKIEEEESRRGTGAMAGATVVLQNDDIHNINDVIQQLMNTYRIEAFVARDWATDVQREGERVLETFSAGSSSSPSRTSDEADADRFWTKALALKDFGLLICVREKAVAYRIATAIWMTSWLHSLAKVGDGMARLVCEGFSLEILERLMGADSRLPQKWAAQLHALYLSLIADQPFKLVVARAYARVLNKLSDDYGAGVGTSEHSLYTLSVQFLNRAYFVNDLVEGQSLLQVLAGSLLNMLERAQGENGELKVDHLILRFRRYAPIIADLRCVLNIEGISELFLSRCLDQWLQILGILHGCDLQVHKSDGGHVEYETRHWMNAFNCNISMSSMFDYLVGWAREGGSPENLHAHIDRIKQVFQETLKRITDFIESKYNRLPFQVRQTYPEGSLILRDFAEQGISFHIIMLRFLGRFVAEAYKSPQLQSELANIVSTLTEDREAVMNMVDVPLRVIAMSAQIKVGMWRRNGQIMNDQVLNYAEPPFCKMFRDQDIFLLQFFGLAYGAAELINHLLHRHNIFDFLVSDNSISEGVKDYGVPLAEEALLAVIVLVTEMPPPSEGKESWTIAMLKREIIHQLVAGPATHSQVAECVHFIPQSDKLPPEMLDDLLAEVSDKRPASGLDPEKFLLKKEFWTAYDPTFHHISLQMHQKALEIRPEPSQPRPLTSVLPTAHKDFNNLRVGILADSTLREVLRTIFKNALHNAEGVSEVLVLRAIHIVTVAVHTCKSEPVEFRQFYAHCVLEELEGGSLLALLLQMRTSNWAQDKAVKQGLAWIFQTLASMDDRCKELVDDGSDARDEARRINLEERKRLAKERAMAMMKQKAAAFAAEMDMEDSEDDYGNAADEEKDERIAGRFPLPKCIVCREMRDDPLGYIGFGQRSKILTSAVPSEYQPDANLYLQFCGHALHYSCFDQYYLTVVHRSEQNNHMVVDVRKGEFRCPLCKTVSNLLIPHITTQMINQPTEPEQADGEKRADDKTEDHKTNGREFTKGVHDIGGVDSLGIWLQETLDDISEQQTESQFTEIEEPTDGTWGIITRLIQSSDEILHDFRFDLQSRGANFALGGLFTLVGGLTYTLKCLFCFNGFSGLFCGNVSEQNKLQHLEKLAYSIHKGITRKQTNCKANIFLAKLLSGEPFNLQPQSQSQRIFSYDTLNLLMIMLECQKDPCLESSKGAAAVFFNMKVAKLVWLFNSLEPAEIEIIQRLKETKASCSHSGSHNLIELLKNWFVKITEIAAIPQNSQHHRSAEHFSDWATPFVQVYLGVALMATKLFLADPDCPVATAMNNSDEGECDFSDQILTYFNIPSTLSSEMEDLIKRWIPLEHDEGVDVRVELARESLGSGSPNFKPVLQRLPHGYTELHSKLASETMTEYPALCLVCGTALSADGKGECTKHAQSCGFGIGIMFLLQECQLLLIHGDRAAYFPSPYVDSYGEKHKNFRGRPLFLDERRMEVVHGLWANHRIPHEVMHSRSTTRQVIINGYY